MDNLYLNTIAFPVRRGSLLQGRKEMGDYRWTIEIDCGESPQLDYQNWADDRVEEPFDVFASAEPSLYAQLLPLRVKSPRELIGRVYSFPQTPDDDPPDWPSGIGWPFFVLYLWENSLAYPMKVAFTKRRGERYRVAIAGEYFNSGVTYNLRVEAWLSWQGADAERSASADRPRE